MAQRDKNYCPIWNYFNEGLHKMGVDNIYHEHFYFFNKMIAVIGEMEDCLSTKTIDKIVEEHNVKVKLED